MKHLTAKELREKIFRSRFFTVSVVIHAAIVILLSVTILFRTYVEPPDFTGGDSGGFVASEPAAQPVTQQLAQQAPTFTVQTPVVPIAITVPAITTTGFSPVVLPAIPAPSGVSKDFANKIRASGGGPGSGSGFGPGGSGGGGSTSFFGLHNQTQAKRIAILLDYSGSMSGPFRVKMEKELERFLNGVPLNSQILIIPWAGPAWLYNQTGPEIAKKWKKNNGEYDNFTLLPGAKLDPPAWISISPESIQQIMKAMQAQVALSGGTDWRSPFRYAMEANPAPDLFYFMTDGQIPPKGVARALSAIHNALSKSGELPVVNCLWIKNKEFPPDTLKKLVKEYHGNFVEIGGN